MGYAIKMLTQHTHQLEPFILYSFPYTVVVLDSIAFKEERYGGQLPTYAPTYLPTWSPDRRVK